MLITMSIDIRRVCEHLGIEPTLSEDEAKVEAPDVGEALKLAGRRLHAWGTRFPKENFSDDDIAVHFQLLDEKGIIVAKGVVSVPWDKEDELMIHEIEGVKQVR
jgi:hypothetical protein